jgi:5-(carboxyamino)imidazole ribonucleotide mutase
MKKSPLVSIIMGSENDLTVMNDAALVLGEYNIPYEIQVVSAHRTPKWMYDFAMKAEKRGIQIIIAGAGGAAHLPGMVASITRLPVIGVPVLVGKLKGLDALLSIAQMPKGVPVATVAIDNSNNAGLLAIRILSLQNKKIRHQLEEFHKNQTTKVLKSNQNVKERNSLIRV